MEPNTSYEYHRTSFLLDGHGVMESVGYDEANREMGLNQLV